MKCETPARATGSSRDPVADPEPERDRANAWDALRDDTLAGRELGEVVLRHAAGWYFERRVWLPLLAIRE